LGSNKTHLDLEERSLFSLFLRPAELCSERAPSGNRKYFSSYSMIHSHNVQYTNPRVRAYHSSPQLWILFAVCAWHFLRSGPGESVVKFLAWSEGAFRNQNRYDAMDSAEYVSVVSPGIRCRVSSNLGKDFAKANMFDGRCDTCWTSKEVNEIISIMILHFMYRFKLFSAGQIPVCGRQF
jgi:hypothetical protein